MGFVWDDFAGIKENPQIRSLTNIHAMFTSSIWGFKHEPSPYYRPVTGAVLAFDYFLWGENPMGYHLTNLMVHAVTSTLVYLIAIRFCISAMAPFCAALLFALHPAHAEAVAWIAGRYDSLTGLCMAGSFLLYLLYRESQKNTYFIASLLLFFVSLLVKEMAVTLPALILLYELVLDKGAWKEKLLRSAAYFMVILPYFMLRMIFLDVGVISAHPLAWRIFTSPGLIAAYLKMLILPVNLKVFHDLPIVKSFSVQTVVIPLAAVSAAAGVAIASGWRDRRIPFTFFWILISLLPVSGILRLIEPALMAERYLYAPSIGFALAVGVAVDSLWGRSGKTRKVGYTFVCSIILGLFFILTVQRNQVWTDNRHFILQWTKDAPLSSFGHNNLGLEFTKEGKTEDAIREYREAIRLGPENVQAHYNLGVAFAGVKRYDEALSEYRTALALKPDHANAWNNMGTVFMSLGRSGEALNAFSKSVEIDPGCTACRANLDRLQMLLKQ